MPEFENIQDPRQRLLARLNYSLRSGSAKDNPLVQDLLRDCVHLTDLDREFVAKHLLEAVEDELGRKLA
jgi:hypothetical protein